MCDFTAFRNKARATFPDLIVSVMMFEKGNGRGVELTMYRVKVAGMSIGADLTSQGVRSEDVLSGLVRQVGAARRAKKEADYARAVARRAAAAQPQLAPVRMMPSVGGTVAQPEPQELAMAA